MISVMIPALNEERHLANTVRDIKQAAKDCGDIKLDIIVVNDGSTDGTQGIADNLAAQHRDVRVVHNKTNIGVGASFQKVIKLPDLLDKFVLVAGDNDMPPDLMRDLFRNCHRADLTFAYFLNREERGVRRNIVSLIYNAIHMIGFSVFIMYISGPCIYPTRLLRTFSIKSARFSIPVELTVKCLRQGSTFIELPGYMQTGVKGSSALSYRNLYDVVLSFFKLFIEIHFTDKESFKKSGVRIH